MEAYSTRTGTRYESWEALVEAESNGWLATAILRENAPRGTLFTWTVGPFPTKREASNARVRLRKAYRRENTGASELLVVNVRPAWKDV